MLVLETQGNSSISQVNNKREKDGESTRQNTKLVLQLGVTE